MSPTFSLVYASRRPNVFIRTINQWHSQAADKSQLEWILCLDSDDAASLSLIPAVPEFVRLGVQSDLPSDCVKAWNFAASMATGRVLIAVSDDFVAPPRWDQQLLEVGLGRWIDQEAVIQVDDGQAARLVTLPIVTRRRYDRYGYLFHPSYQSMYADDELTAVAVRDGILFGAPEVLFQHRHWNSGGRTKDHVDAAHSSAERMLQGRRTFEARRAAGFPTEWPLAAARQQ